VHVSSRVSRGRLVGWLVLAMLETADAHSHRGDPPVFCAMAALFVEVPQKRERATMIGGARGEARAPPVGSRSSADGEAAAHRPGVRVADKALAPCFSFSRKLCARRGDAWSDDERRLSRRGARPCRRSAARGGRRALSRAPAMRLRARSGRPIAPRSRARRGGPGRRRRWRGTQARRTGSACRSSPPSPGRTAPPGRRRFRRLAGLRC
jgi:hypothetical protein